uniref:Peptidase M12B domain-containing protein n=1 Tax=Biomphalaria glabrata TaxID=6526 RepID=A0A2C9KKF4_BIOGL
MKQVHMRLSSMLYNPDMKQVHMRLSSMLYNPDMKQVHMRLSSMLYNPDMKQVHMRLSSMLYNPDMKQVKTIYQSPSIGNFINVVVVKLIIYEKSSETPFKVNQSAAGTLKNFCQWQHKNKESSKESHYDTAILITRENICRAPGKCDTLGLAELGTICDKLRSCSLIEDNGISAAFTIAHELGHVFNLPHDDDKQCTESLPENQKVAFHVMAPTLDYNASPWDWSSCSAKLMTDFLESGLASCLLDGPRVKTWMSTMQSLNQPGWNYSVNKQCKFVFGEEFALCPYSMTMNNPVCRRLWCTNSSDSKIGCRTKHMPWADGTPCGDNKVCQHGDCLVVTEPKPKAVNGGWGHWKQYGPCSRTCGGGVKSKIRECDNPVPKNGGTYCLGARVRYKSCFVKECPSPSRDFRAMQCDSEEMRRKNRVKELPNNSTWNPKTSGVHLKDVCKLYCGAGNSSIYSLFAKKVIDGTKCGPYTEDICVNGQCWAVGCDNKLGSKMKRDMCGVCGGDNFTCRSVTGIFNNAIYGYNLVGTIPQGATHIDIRQYGQMRHTKDDDNYLALKDSQQRYILNGEYSVRTEPWKIKLGGAIIEYSGSEEFVERINTTMIIGEDITLYVLSVGKLNPPNITYSYLVSVTKKVVWKNLGWSKCNSVCNGERKSLIKCVREEDTHKVQPKRCSNLERPKAISERCNTDCTISWRVFKNEECPVRCGKGMRRQLVHCVKVTDYKNVVIIHDKECIKLYGAKPDEHVPCDGSCLPTYWTYTEWSQCSSSCGDGLQHRQAKCVDDTAKELPDKECAGKDKELTRHCSNPQCAEWTTTQWTGCSVTCGYGYKQRKVLCVQGNQKVEDGLCSKKKPVNKKECTLKECPEWTAGGWGPCSVTCGKGVNMRAVKCRTGNFSQEDDVCDLSRKVNDRQPCFLGPCPTEAPTSTTTIKSVSKGGFWRAGAWTECSSLCDSGTKYRVVSCTAYNGTVLDESECSHLQRPASKENCFLRPCGHWHQGDWSDCSVTCGSGVQIRYVSCTFNKQRQDERFCDVSVKPETEIQCNRGTCLSHEDLSIAVITSNKVVGTSHWRIGPWSSCSSTCGSGWERRLVVCSDEKGPSKNCDITLRPDEFKACDSGACPSWKTDVWSNCSASDCDSEGIQKRLVVCQLPNNDILANSNCDPKKKPPELQNCKAQCQRPEGTWKEGSWSGVSPTKSIPSSTQGQRLGHMGRLHYQLPVHQRQRSQDRNYMIRYSKYYQDRYVLSTPTAFLSTLRPSSVGSSRSTQDHSASSHYRGFRSYNDNPLSNNDEKLRIYVHKGDQSSFYEQEAKRNAFHNNTNTPRINVSSNGSKYNFYPPLKSSLPSRNVSYLPRRLVNQDSLFSLLKNAHPTESGEFKDVHYWSEHELIINKGGNSTSSEDNTEFAIEQTPSREDGFVKNVTDQMKTNSTLESNILYVSSTNNKTNMSSEIHSSKNIKIQTLETNNFTLSTNEDTKTTTQS